LELYQNPANKFVAGFIGSPKMNFVPKEADRFFTSNDISDANISCVGIRPEHVALASNNNERHLEGVVEVVEQLGSDTIVYLNYGHNELFVVRLAGIQSVNVGEKIKCTFAPEHVHGFDRNGVTIPA
ncbi:MAG: ABC transporter ATP-binding protein, partial [Roseibium sp.]|uniref:TOBE domain-containing protein n=1 Tax=Roseibium sp. TaxID=1936156 RepID=UPI001B1C3DF9